MPCARGELEITPVNQQYLKMNRPCVEFLARGFAWLDTGPHESQTKVSNFVENIDH